MKFDGIQFRKTKNIVVLPAFDKNGSPIDYGDGAKPNYVRFGRVVKIGKPVPDNAVETNLTFANGCFRVFATPVDIEGHSLTNMAYGKDGRAYLCKDGECYVSAKLSGQ